MALRRTGAACVIADLDAPATLGPALDGAGLVFHCAAHYPALSVDREATMALGLRQLETLLDACAERDVRRLVYVSSTATVDQAPGRVATEAHVFGELPTHGVYHELKWRLEQRALAEDRFEVVTVCPAACIGPWDLRIGTSAMLVAVARGLPVPHPDGWIQTVDSRDVGDFAVRLAQLPDTPRRVILAATNHRLDGLLAALAVRYGAPPPPAPLSDDAAREIADAEELRCHAEGGRPAVSREIVDLIVSGGRMDGSLAERVTGLAYRPFDATLEAWEQWALRRRILPTPKAPAPDFTREPPATWP